MVAVNTSSPPEGSLNIFKLQVGSLSSISSLHHAIGDQLVRYNQLYMRGGRPSLVFDLTNVQPKRIGMAALTALLSVMDRFRDFSTAPASIEVRWNPMVFGFLDDIGFFDLGRELDLFVVEDQLLGGYSPGRTNPNTQLLFSRFDDDWSLDIRKQAQQKDAIRNQIKETLLTLCGELFRSRRGARAIPSNLRDQILVTTAELVVNAHLWGRSNAFVGLQRSSKGITVCVCDNGDGFLNSLQKKNKERFSGSLSGHLESLALGSIVNDEDFGLRRAIDMVTRFGGYVELASYTGEIVWGNDLWQYWVKVATDSTESRLTLDERFHCMRREFETKVTGPFRKRVGYCKNWTAPLRGSRVTFELPIQDI